LDAFRALRALRDEGILSVNVAVVSPEAPEGLVQAADLAIEQPLVPRLLEVLRDWAAPPAGGTDQEERTRKEGG
jgi:hypothetical protein